MKIRMHITLIALALAASASIAGGQPVPPANSNANKIEGVWRVTRVGINCQSGNPGPFSFPAILAFHNGGTFTGHAIAPGETPATTSPEFGVWKKERGHGNYSFHFVSYAYTAAGAFDGSTETISNALVGNDGVLRIQSSISFFDANGNLLATVCGQSTGTRFE